MKKLFILIVAFGVFTSTLISCGGEKKETTNEDEEQNEYGAASEENEQASGGNDDQSSTEEMIKQGQALVDGSDCKTCHHATNKIIGPAHAEVAKKYDFTQANVTYLAGKIMNGGSGVWGEIPMTPHPDLSQADAEKMAIYVLSLDNEEPKL